MSGGHFDWKQWHIREIASVIEKSLKDSGENYSPETIEHIKTGLDAIKRAEIWANRIDWLLTLDDNEDQFIEKVRIDLNKLEK